MKYADILFNNRLLEKKLGSINFNISLLSNIVLNQAKDIFEYYLRKNGIYAGLTLGEYDNIVQDSFKCENKDTVIIFWEPANFIDGFQYRANNFNDIEIDELIEKLKKDIQLTLSNLKEVPIIVFNKFSSLVFNSKNLSKNNFDIVCEELNQFLLELNQKNLLIIDIDKVLSRVGLFESIDFRYYYSSKSLYKAAFLEEYINYVLPIFLNKTGKTKKALILDCDNTLWNGIVGEDGLDGIKMSSETKEGVVFEEIQEIVSALAKKGIIVGLCSKNNPNDVDEVISNHPDFRLKDDDIVIKKINWVDKATNLYDIANELNIGLDSLVFIDDSNFEIELIKQKLPNVTTIQRPVKLSEYPMDLAINVSKDDEKSIPRISQLTQKTNQFNFTTKRYSESEISNFMGEENFIVFSISVKDRFSDSGLTSVLIIEIQKKTAIIDTFLMSCRVIGRNIEYSIMDHLVKYLSSLEIDVINATYIESPKNGQLKGLYEKLGFTLIEQTSTELFYQLNVNEYKPHQKNYITVNNG